MNALLIDVALVKHLISTQFPQWKDLTIQPVEVGGWDNRTFHLGKEMLVRMPSAQRYALQVEKEQKWLPKLAPLLPLPIPEPVAMGKPSHNYPWKWSMYRWLEGETVASSPIAYLDHFATDLAQFLIALQNIDTTGGPLPKPHNFSHLAGLAHYDTQTREAMAILKNKINIEAATKLWEEALDTTWSHDPVWVHGDVSPTNLLVQEGRLSAVIDFGGLGIGDPACDLVIAWKLFREKSRKTFRAMLPLDEGTWSRGRAWALWKALIIAAGIIESNPTEMETAWPVIHETLTDFASS